ncbi:DNA-3-methyladenine glycosylase I [Alicyclobacillus acidiphilus]|uniref:DNA-3-methyladenine glycosylase I n=1 Tax=Alicyclobacillus acidiphilus TaxID=182455 RepID=UPI0008348004|nr:DNA-3-methyladenine glycosylase I [Alicyclobacillus acidiphilus]
MERCGWVNQDPLYLQYHDCEWGVPVYDDSTLFEFLILEGAQAGLSWYTILKKREGYRLAFANFDPQVVADFSDEDVERLLGGEYDIVRNRLKIRSAIGNARAFCDIQVKHGSFSNYLWSFVDGRPQINHWTSLDQVPAETELSQAISKELRRTGLRFVGPTILYSYLQAVGVVMDHLTTCFRYRALS